MAHLQDSPVTLYLTRYGLPVVVLLFQLTAWLQTRIDGTHAVAAEMPWVVRYRTNLDVRSIDSSGARDAESLVTSRRMAMDGYVMVYEPFSPGQWHADRSIAVWRKR